MAKAKIDYQLDEEEKEILEAYESGKLASAPVPEAMVLAAKETMRKNKNINIRISENDYSGSTTPPEYSVGSTSLSRCINFLSNGVSTSKMPATASA